MIVARESLQCSQHARELIFTHEKGYYCSYFIKNETYDLVGVSNDAIAEYVRYYSNPGDLRSMLAVYRATLDNGNNTAKTKLTIPILSIGSEHFITKELKGEIENVAKNVDYICCQEM